MKECPEARRAGRESRGGVRPARGVLRAPGRALLATLLTAFPLLPACGSGDGAPEAAADGPAIAAERVATIGCSDCGGPEQLDVFALAVAPDGRVWTLDRYAPIVRVFGPDGGVLGAFGQLGEGPGEFTGAGADAFVPGLAIYPTDDGRAFVHRRVPAGLMEFDVDTGHVGATSFEWPASRIPRSVSWDARTRTAFVTAFALPRAEAPPADQVAVYRLEIERTDGRAAAGDTSGEPTDQTAQETVRVAVAQVGVDPDLFPRSEVDPESPSRAFPIAQAPDGSLAIGDPLRYEITRVDPAGSVVATFGRDLPRPPKDEDRLRRERERAARRGRRAAEVPEVLPHFGADAFDFDAAGRLWVGTNRRAGGGAVFDVFAPGGDLLAEVRIPEPLQEDGLTSFEVSGGRLVAVVVGPGGNDRIGVWRVVESAPVEKGAGAGEERDE